MSGILARAADLIEPHINGKFRVRDRAEGAAADLSVYNLLRGFPDPGKDAQERAARVLSCRFGDITAERIAAELAAADLLNIT